MVSYIDHLIVNIVLFITSLYVIEHIFLKCVAKMYITDIWTHTWVNQDHLNTLFNDLETGWLYVLDIYTTWQVKTQISCRIDPFSGILVQGRGGRDESSLDTAYILAWNDFYIVYVCYSEMGTQEKQWCGQQVAGNLV